MSSDLFAVSFYKEEFAFGPPGYSDLIFQEDKESSDPNNEPEDEAEVEASTSKKSSWMRQDSLLTGRPTAHAQPPKVEVFVSSRTEVFEVYTLTKKTGLEWFDESKLHQCIVRDLY